MWEKVPVDILMCSCFSPKASGLSTVPLVNTLGDHVLFGPHEALPIHLCLRRLVHDHVKTVRPAFESTVQNIIGFRIVLHTVH